MPYLDVHFLGLENRTDLGFYVIQWKAFQCIYTICQKSWKTTPIPMARPFPEIAWRQNASFLRSLSRLQMDAGPLRRGPGEPFRTFRDEFAHGSAIGHEDRRQPLPMCYQQALPTSAHSTKGLSVAWHCEAQKAEVAQPGKAQDC